MKREDLHVGQKVNVHEPGREVIPGEVTKIGRTLVTIKQAGWPEAQYYIDGGGMKGDYSMRYFFRTPAQEEEHAAYEKSLEVLKHHGFEAYRVHEKQKVIAVAGLLLNQFESA